MRGVLILIATFAIYCAFGRFSKALDDARMMASKPHFSWKLIFLQTIFQMSTSLRPLLSAEENDALRGKRFFIQRWGSCIDNEECFIANSSTSGNPSVNGHSSR